MTHKTPAPRRIALMSVIFGTFVIYDFKFANLATSNRPVCG